MKTVLNVSVSLQKGSISQRQGLGVRVWRIVSINIVIDHTLNSLRVPTVQYYYNSETSLQWALSKVWDRTFVPCT